VEGGFLNFRDGRTGTVETLDFRERAPSGMKLDLYRNEKGELDGSKLEDGYLSVGVPGMVQGMYEFHRKYGKSAWKDLVLPAAEIAERGITISRLQSEEIREVEADLKKDPLLHQLLTRESGEWLKEGDVLKQSDLARILREIADKGPRGIYQGEFARELFKLYSEKRPGYFSKKDFLNIKTRWLQPLKFRYRGMDVYTMPPPSFGGIIVRDVLYFAEKDNLRPFGYPSVEALKTIVKAGYIAFRDRKIYGGDPEIHRIPVQKLISAKHLDESERDPEL